MLTATRLTPITLGLSRQAMKAFVNALVWLVLIIISGQLTKAGVPPLWTWSAIIGIAIIIWFGGQIVVSIENLAHRIADRLEKNRS